MKIINPRYDKVFKYLMDETFRCNLEAEEEIKHRKNESIALTFAIRMKQSGANIKDIIKETGLGANETIDF